MQSIRELYKIGSGPSSSHTLGPAKAASRFKERNKDASGFRVTLYGSLAATGKGHLTDRVITDNLAPQKTEILWKPTETLPLHPNGMLFQALDGEGHVLDEWRPYSVGGGELIDEKYREETPPVYPSSTMGEILIWSEKTGRNMYEYVFECEDPGIIDYLREVWEVMREAIRRGLEKETVLPGSLHLRRKACSYYLKSKNSSGFVKQVSKIFSYALSVAEENADGNRIATAPTCGSAGVLASVLRFLEETYKLSEGKVVQALATAGLIGNIVKNNGSISGAEVGCQGEIGTACAMAAGAAAQLLGGTQYQVEYAAEIGLEHHLGLTCDPVAGLVQIPCIERNAMAAARALDCAIYALLSDGKHRIKFDEVVITMTQTGRDLMSKYKETSMGGLAKVHDERCSSD